MNKLYSTYKSHEDVINTIVCNKSINNVLHMSKHKQHVINIENAYYDLRLNRDPMVGGDRLLVALFVIVASEPYQTMVEQFSVKQA